MKKLLLAVSALFLVSAVFAQSERVAQMRQNAPSKVMQKTELTGFEEGAVPQTLAPITRAHVRDFIGMTYYDLQTNGSMSNRIVAHNDQTVSAIWTTNGSTTSSRGTGYNYYNSSNWINSSTSTARIENARSGWGTITCVGDAEIVASHNGSTALIIAIRPHKGTGDWTFSTGTISCSTPTPQTQYNYARYTWSQDPSTYSESADSAHDETIFSSGTYSISGYPSAPIVNGQFSETGAYTTITKAYDDSGDFFLYTVSPDGKTRTTHELKLATALDPDSKYITWMNTVVETPGAYVKGDYVDTIQSPAGIYPDDGISGAYWYVKGAVVGELHDPSTDVDSTVVNSSGVAETNAAYTTTDWIAVTGNELTLETAGSEAGTLKLVLSLYSSNSESAFLSQVIDTYTGGSHTMTRTAAQMSGATYVRVSYIAGLSLSVVEASGALAVATSDAYTLSEEKNAVTLESISTDDGTATVGYQVTLDGSNWSDITPGQAITLPPGNSLQVRIIGKFVDNTSYTVSCDGFAVLCYKVESDV